MPDELEPLVPITVWLLSTVLILVRPRQSALRIAVIAALSMAVLVPSFSTSATVAIAAVLGTNASLSLALLKDLRSVNPRRVPFVLIAFLLWSAIVGAINAPFSMVLLYLATGSMLVLLALAVPGATRRGGEIFLPFFAIVVLFEFLVGVGEQFFGTLAMWPRADGSDLITHRSNSVAPFLLGRAMGSASQPIPYGILVGFCVLVCVWYLVMKRRYWLLLPTALGGAALVFSGTRNAILGVLVGIAVWFLLQFWRKRLVVIPFLALAAIGAPVAVYVGFLAGGDELANSSSLVHRLGILETAGNLFQRAPMDVLFGTGFSSIKGLIESGLISGADGLTVIDQEFVRTLAGTGIVGLALLLVTLALGFLRGSQLTRILIAFLAVGFIAFDSLSWRLIQTLFVFVVSYGYGLALRRDPDSVVTSGDIALVSDDEQLVRRASRRLRESPR